MEERLKRGYQFIIGKNRSGKVSGALYKYTSSDSIEDLIEVDHSLLISILRCMPSVGSTLDLGKRLVLRYDLEDFSYCAVVEEHKLEGPYCDNSFYQTLIEEKDPVLSCAMVKLEEASLKDLQRESNRKEEEKKLSLEDRILAGYHLLIRHDGMGELEGGLIYENTRGLLDFIRLEEEQLAVVQKFPFLEEALYKGGVERLLKVHYDPLQKSFLSSIREMEYMSDGCGYVEWPLLKEECGDSLYTSFKKLEDDFRPKNEKGKEFLKCKKHC